MRAAGTRPGAIQRGRLTALRLESFCQNSQFAGLPHRVETHWAGIRAVAKRQPPAKPYRKPNMLSFLAKSIETVVDVARLPISALADTVTLCGAINDREEPYTVTNVKQIVADVESLATGEGNGG